MTFWDTSAIIPLVVHEATSPSIRSVFRQDRVIVTWWGSQIEGVSALAFAARRGVIAQDASGKALRRLRSIMDAAVIIEPSAAVRDRAERLLLVHDLRSGDALQLAAALVACQDRPKDFGLVSLDRRLSQAAEREGFTAWP